MVHFASNNDTKYMEYEQIFNTLGKSVDLFCTKIKEIQDEDVNVIAKEKVMSAYLLLGRPVFVEHTSLHIEYLNGFPGGLTQIFLDKVGEKKICELFGARGRNKAYGTTTIAYCDGMKVFLFSGTLQGRISAAFKGGDGQWAKFGWNRIFVPNGYNDTLSDLGLAIKTKISMRRKATNKLIKHLERAGA
jgi:XTP/dITP diphosphohydrolase